MSIHHITTNIYKKILSGEAELPALPDISSKIRKAVSKKNVSIKSITKIVQLDPGLSAYLVKVSQSPIYRGACKITNVNAAISRIGIDATRNLATSYTIKSLYVTTSPKTKKIMVNLWKQSARTAAISSVLASKIQGIDADEAMLGGLLQDVGASILLAELKSHPLVLMNEELVLKFINEHSADVGVVLLKYWGFGKDFEEVARSREKWNYESDKDISLADIVLAARLHSYAGTPAMKTLPALEDIPAFHKVSACLGHLTPAKSLEYLGEAKQNITEVMQLLR